MNPNYTPQPPDPRTAEPPYDPGPWVELAVYLMAVTGTAALGFVLLRFVEA